MRNLSLLILIALMATKQPGTLNAQSLKRVFNNKFLAKTEQQRKIKAHHNSLVFINANSGVKLGMARDISDSTAPGGLKVSLEKEGDGLKFLHLTAAKKIAVHYASLNSGTFRIYLNGVFVKKINLHSTGAALGSYRNAIIDLPVPANAALTLQFDPGDVAWSIDHIALGAGEMGLNPIYGTFHPSPFKKGNIRPIGNN